MSFDVQIDDTRVQTRLSGIPQKMHAALVRKTTVLRLELEAKVKAAAPVKTGALRRGVFSDQTDTATSVEGRVAESADVPYAKWVNDGTSAHDILPSKAKALAFVVGGKQVFAKIVHHPGTKANPYMTGTFQAMRPEIVEGYRQVAKEAHL